MNLRTFLYAVCAALIVPLGVPAATSEPMTERVSVDSAGGQTNNASGEGDSISPAVSADGRFVAFVSGASNLVAGDTNFVLDAVVGVTGEGSVDRASVHTAGGQANVGSISPAVSADGRFVAFASLASNLVAGDTNNDFDVFVRDRQTGATERVSVDSAGGQANGGSGFQIPGFVGRNVAITADGRFVAFASLASNLVAGDTNGLVDVFVPVRAAGQAERVGVADTVGEGGL